MKKNAKWVEVIVPVKFYVLGEDLKEATQYIQEHVWLDVSTSKWCIQSERARKER